MGEPSMSDSVAWPNKCSLVAFSSLTMSRAAAPGVRRQLRATGSAMYRIHLLALLAAAHSASAQETTFVVRQLTPETAIKAAQAALASCRASGYQVAVAIVDRGGITQVLLRDRFAGPHTVEIAIDKAWTAASFRPGHYDAQPKQPAGAACGADPTFSSCGCYGRRDPNFSRWQPAWCPSRFQAHPEGRRTRRAPGPLLIASGAEWSCSIRASAASADFSVLSLATLRPAIARFGLF